MKTSKGTELPVLKLRGKDYLEVKYRIVWFREEHPTWSIETEFVSVIEQNSAMAKAIIRDESGRVISTSHKTENSKGFPDFYEKAETGAIGRALALIGYGTQFCADELDEGERIVDFPREPRISLKDTTSIGEYVISFGKFKDRALEEVPFEDLEGYVNYIKNSASKDKKQIAGKVKEFIDAVHAYGQELNG